MKNMIKQKRGFTLIELIVVIAVIGILVLLAAPKFLGHTKDAKLAQIQNDVKAHEDAIVAEMVSGEQEKIDEWGWDSASIETVKDYMNEGSLFDKKGKVKELNDDEFFLINNEDVTVNSKLKGDFIYAKGGKVYYYENGMGGEGSSEPEEIPEDFTLLTDDDFEFIETGSSPNEYTIDGKTTKGYFHYIGEADKVVIPHEIMGSEVKDYYRMFYYNGHESRKIFGATGGNGEKVTAVISDNPKITDMTQMFEDSQATKLDLSNFDTSNVTSMGGIFWNSQAVDLVGLDEFDTSSVIDMVRMFDGSQANELDLSSWDTSNVTDMNSMLMNVSFDLAKAGVENFDMKKVTNTAEMFAENNDEINNISNLNLSEWKLDSLETLGYSEMSFREDGSSSGGTGAGGMFSNVTAKNIVLGENFNLKGNLRGLFRDSRIDNLDISGMKISGDSTHLEGMFYDFEGSVEMVDLSKHEVSSAESMFYRADIDNLDISNINIDSNTNVDNIFSKWKGSTDVKVKDSNVKQLLDNSKNKPGSLNFTY